MPLPSEQHIRLICLDFFSHGGGETARSVILGFDAIITHQPGLIYGLQCSPRYLSAILPSVRADIVLPLVATLIYLLSFVSHPTAPFFCAMTPRSRDGEGRVNAEEERRRCVSAEREICSLVMSVSQSLITMLLSDEWLMRCTKDMKSHTHLQMGRPPLSLCALLFVPHWPVLSLQPEQFPFGREITTSSVYIKERMVAAERVQAFSMLLKYAKNGLGRGGEGEMRGNKVSPQRGFRFIHVFKHLTCCHALVV